MSYLWIWARIILNLWAWRLKIDFEFQSMPNSAVDRYGHILGARNSDFSFLIRVKQFGSLFFSKRFHYIMVQTKLGFCEPQPYDYLFRGDLILNSKCRDLHLISLSIHQTEPSLITRQDEDSLLTKSAIRKNVG